MKNILDVDELRASGIRAGDLVHLRTTTVGNGKDVTFIGEVDKGILIRINGKAESSVIPWEHINQFWLVQSASQT